MMSSTTENRAVGNTTGGDIQITQIIIAFDTEAADDSKKRNRQKRWIRKLNDAGRSIANS